MSRESDRGRVSPSEIVIDLIAAISDGRIGDVQALVHPEVIWRPLARPGLSQYDGRDGIVRFIADLRTAYGPYRVEIDDLIEETDTRVVVLAHVVHQTETGERPGPATRSTFTLHEGLVLAMQADDPAD
jgi:ketosteroid isomerase-like protein